MKAVIEKALEAQRAANKVNYEAGAIRIFGINYELLHERAYVFRPPLEGGSMARAEAHVEIALLDEEIVGKFRNDTGALLAHKIFLYTYFCPCPNCTDYLVFFAWRHRPIKFHLAFWSNRPQNALYSDDDVRRNLIALYAVGWSISHWTPGTSPPAKKLHKLIGVKPSSDGRKMEPIWDSRPKASDAEDL